MIAQGAQFQAPVDPFAQYGKLQQLQQNQQANALNQMKMDEYVRGQQESNALRQFLPGLNETNRNQLLGYGTAGQGVYKALGEGDTQRRLADQAKSQVDVNKSNILKNAVAQTRDAVAGIDATDAPSYMALRESVLAQYPDLAPYMPAGWDANVKQRLITTAASVLEGQKPAAPPASIAEFSAFLKLPPDQQAEFMRLKKAGAANVSASATTSPTGKSLSEPVGKRVETSLVKAEGATSMMDTANLVREALNTGNVIAGPLAGVRTKFAQVLELAGAGDKEKLVNTRSAIQGLAGLTLESRAELRGQGQITDTETKLLEKARSADINDMTIPELQQIVSISQRLASRLFSNHQTLLGRMKDDPAAKDSMRYYEPTGQMAAPTLEGKTPAVQSKDAKRPSLGSIFGGSPQGGK
jgi:hypothetical protein